MTLPEAFQSRHARSIKYRLAIARLRLAKDMTNWSSGCADE
jgi:hypothetical protein